MNICCAHRANGERTLSSTAEEVCIIVNVFERACVVWQLVLWIGRGCVPDEDARDIIRELLRDLRVRRKKC